jgi:Tfp pilus assembly protein PilV
MKTMGHGGGAGRTGVSVGRPRRQRAATSLIEVMVGVLILTVVALCSNLLLTRTHTILVQQTQRRVALGVADARVEALRASSYQSVCQLGSNATVFVKAAPAGWVASTVDPGEVSVVAGMIYGLTTRLTAVDLDGVAPATDCLLVEVTVRPPQAGARVTLLTYYARLEHKL